MACGILRELPLYPSSSHSIEHRAVEGAILLPRLNAPALSTPVQSNYSLRLTNHLFREMSLYLPGVCLESLAAPSGLVWFGNSCSLTRKLRVCERVRLSVCEIKRYVCLNALPVQPFLPHLYGLDMFGHM